LRARIVGRLCLLAAALLALAGCRGGKEGSPAAASAIPAPEPSALPSARRPLRRYYLERTAARCEVYSADPDGGTPPAQTPCPLDLQVGEKLRIAGKTCVRESVDPARVLPVVCPDPLTNLEKRDLAARAPAP
jgi:hypothetical protein